MGFLQEATDKVSKGGKKILKDPSQIIKKPKEEVARATLKAEGKQDFAEGVKADAVKAGDERQKTVAELREDQVAADLKIQALFESLEAPGLTGPALDKIVKKIGKIDTAQFSGQATDDIDRLRQIALTKGPSEGAKALLKEQRAEEGIRLEQIEGAGAQQAASAFESLASRGGASAGSRERLLGQAGGQSLAEQQKERRSGALARLGVRSGDEAQKLGLLQALPGQELATGQLVGATQKAQAQSQLGQANLQQQASQFDVGQQSRFDQFKTLGKAGQTQSAIDKATQFESAQILADAQARKPKDKGFLGIG